MRENEKRGQHGGFPRNAGRAVMLIGSGYLTVSIGVPLLKTSIPLGRASQVRDDVFRTSLTELSSVSSGKDSSRFFTRPVISLTIAFTSAATSSSRDTFGMIHPFRTGVLFWWQAETET